MNASESLRPIVAASPTASQQTPAADLPIHPTPAPDARQAQHGAEGTPGMTNTIKILAIIDRALVQTDAMETLAACMSQGMTAGVLDAAHVHTLLSTQATAIRTLLVRLASEVEQQSETAPMGDAEG